MDHAPRRFTCATHFARVLAGLNEQINAGGARGIDYERAAEPKTCAPVRAMGSPVEDLIAERGRLRLVLRHVRNAILTRGVELRAWRLHRLEGVSYGVLAQQTRKPLRSVKRWVARADEAITDTLQARGMLAPAAGLSATEQEKEKGVVWSTAWEVV